MTCQWRTIYSRAAAAVKHGGPDGAASAPAPGGGARMVRSAMTETAQLRPLVVPCLAAAAHGVTFLNHAPLIPLMVRDLGISPVQAGLLSAAMFFSGGVLSLPLGALTDRLSPKRVIGWSMALLAASTIGLGLAPSFVVMLALKACGGAGLAAIFVAGAPYVSTVAGGQRQFLAQGLFGGAIQLGIGSGIFGLPLIAGVLGWRTALVLSGVPIAAAWLLWEWAAVRAPAPARQPGLTRVVRDLAVWRLGLAHTATFSLAIALGTWISVYFVHEFGLSLGLAGVLGSLGILLGVPTRPVGGLLVASGSIRPRSLIVSTLAALTAALVVLALPARPLAAALGGILMVGAAASLSYAAVVTLVTRAQPQAAGAALGLVGVVSTLGVIVGAPLLGALYAMAGHFTLPLLALAALPAGAGLACRGLPPD